MWAVSVSVHIAVLAVAKDGAPTHAVTDLAVAAGHEIVARATVMDSVTAVRGQLERWIADTNIDVIIVSGGAESSSASAAMKPLVTQTLPGFTDLFRFLAFQEIGASAMQSNAEAAQCNTTFVFVLPASAGAVRAAMEKLILPQLDYNTMPTNLVTQMPRIHEIDTDAVPKILVKEKTVGGSGLTPKSPARTPAPGVPDIMRDRPRTGANLVARRSIDDPVTKPIDVAKLEAQIALSESGSQATKRVDLARLPKLPPGADDSAGDEDEILMRDPRKVARASRPDSGPIGPPSPDRPLQHTPSRGAGVAKVPAVPSLPLRKSQTEPPPTPRKIQRTDVAAVVPPVRPSVPKLRVDSVPGDDVARHRTTTKPSDPPPRPMAAVDSAGSRTSTSNPPSRVTEPNEVMRSRTATKPSDPPPPRPPSQSVEAVWSRPTKTPTEPPPTPAADASRGSRKPTNPPPLPAPPSGNPDGSQRARVPTNPSPLPVVADSSRGLRKPTDPPPVPTRAASGSTGPVRTVSATNGTPSSAAQAVDPASSVRLPAPRKMRTDDLGTLIVSPMPSSTSDSEFSAFNYPIKKNSNKLLWFFAMLAALSLGFFIVVKLYPQSSSPARTEPSPTPVAVTASSPDAAVAEAPAPIPAPAPAPAPDPVPVVAAPPPEPATPAQPVASARPPTTTAAAPPRGRPATTPATKAAAGNAAVTKPSQTGSQGATAAAEVPDADPPIAPPISTSDCDEVACVLSKYDRPCCLKFKPAESEIKPRTVGGIPSELDKAAVRSGMEKIKPRVVACGETSTDKGIVKVAVVVKPDGSVTSASVVVAPNPALGDCVAAAIRKAAFAKSVSGGSFTYPFAF